MKALLGFLGGGLAATLLIGNMTGSFTPSLADQVAPIEITTVSDERSPDASFDDHGGRSQEPEESNEPDESFDDHGGSDDNSGPGSTDSPDDNSGSGSDNSGSGSDNSGPGSGDDSDDRTPKPSETPH